MSPDEQLLHVIKKSGFAKRMLPDLALAQARQCLRLVEVNSKALLRYAYPRYQGRVVYFRALERDGDSSTTPEQGFRDLVEGGLILHDVPGNHITMNLRPNVDVIAEHLSAHIEEALSAHTRPARGLAAAG